MCLCCFVGRYVYTIDELSKDVITCIVPNAPALESNLDHLKCVVVNRIVHLNISMQFYHFETYSSYGTYNDCLYTVYELIIV